MKKKLINKNKIESQENEQNLDLITKKTNGKNIYEEHIFNTDNRAEKEK